MKLLLDACVWGPARMELQTAGHDVTWAGDWPVDPGDERILAIAASEKRVLVTLDKDFGELTIVRELPHWGIIRLVDCSARSQARACLDVLNQFGNQIHGAIVTVEPGRIRFRPASPDEE